MERIKIHQSSNRSAVFIGLICLVLILFPFSSKSQEKSVQTKGGSKMLEHVHWLGQSGIKITGDKIIYIDPFDIPEGEAGDLIFITHDHRDHLSEMKSIRADVVFLPVGGTFTMNPEEAAEAVRDIHPKVAVPIHWGSVVGSKEDALRFQSLCDCEVQILEPEN